MTQPDPLAATRAAVNRLAAAAETLAAVGLALAQHAGEVTLPPALASGIDAVAATAVGDLGGLEPDQARAVGSLARALLAQAAAFCSHPQEPSAWAVTDPLVLQSLGQGSAALAAPIGDLLVPRYAGLGERLGASGAAILDVGTGVAALAAALAHRFPEATVVGLDVWEPALELARANITGAGLAGRVELRNQDVSTLDYIDAFDLVWFAGPFIPTAILDEALRRVTQATRPGGIVVFGTFGGNDAHTDALADLRVLRSGGSVLSDDEIAERLTATGLDNVEYATVNIGMPTRLVAAQRPA
jgi:SAM-dependent methyltransferase